MFPLCTAASLETTLKYGTTQSWREDSMLEWNGSYDTLNKYDNKADTTDCQGGYLCYVKRTVGRLELKNTATVKVEVILVHSSTQQWRWDVLCCGMRFVSVSECLNVLTWCDCWKIEILKFYKFPHGLSSDIWHFCMRNIWLATHYIWYNTTVIQLLKKGMLMFGCFGREREHFKVSLCNFCWTAR